MLRALMVGAAEELERCDLSMRRRSSVVGLASGRRLCTRGGDVRSPGRDAL